MTTIEWNSETLNNAARTGDLALMKFAHENGFVDTTMDFFENTKINEVASIAAANGQLECLKYACEHFMPIESHEPNSLQYHRVWTYLAYRNNIVIEAVKNGHLDCLQFCMQYFNIRMDESIVLWCIKRNQQACLAYCMEYDDKIMSRTLLKWLNKCNIDLNVDAYPVFRTLFSDDKIKEDEMPNLYKQLREKRDKIEQEKNYILHEKM